ncbi:MAG: hypothetical protein HYY17_03780 [Planctomycetes bacterium]|nr:hypothetical protein [Planctomycetota bacterium]
MSFVTLFSTFTVALLHTLIPSHWLCFVAVGKAQQWRLRKTLAVSAAAGALHVATTVALGIAIILVGRRFLDGERLEKASGAILIGLGAFYLILHALRAGHHHVRDAAIPHKVAVLSLMLTVAVSPCSGAIPFLVAAAGSSKMVAMVAAVLLVTTIGNMLLLVGLTSLGIEKLKFDFIEKYEKLLVGGVLCLLGTAVLLAGH